MARILVADVMDAAEKVINRKSGHIDRVGGAYTYEDGSHCLVGEIALELGLELPPPDHYLNCRSVKTVAAEMLWSVTPHVLTVFSYMQQMNDEHVSWDSIVWEITTILEDEGLLEGWK